MRSERPTALAARRNVSSVTDGIAGSKSRSSWRRLVIVLLWPWGAAARTRRPRRQRPCLRGEVGGSAGFADEDAFGWIKIELAGEPVRALLQNVRALLLRSVRGNNLLTKPPSCVHDVFRKPQWKPYLPGLIQTLQQPELVVRFRRLLAKLAGRAGVPNGLVRWAGRRPIPGPSILQFSIERRLSTKSNVDLAPTPVIQERHEQRTFRDLESIYAGEDDATTNPARVLDGNRVSRGSVFHRRLVLVPSLGDAGIDSQERSAELQTEQALDPRALQPTGRTGVPGPTATSNVGRC